MLDEPTAALAVTQTQRVLALVRRVESGKGIILISHDIRDVLAVADTVVVCRHGRVAYNGPASTLTESELVHLIAGIDIQRHRPIDRTTSGRKYGDYHTWLMTTKSPLGSGSGTSPLSTFHRRRFYTVP